MKRTYSVIALVLIAVMMMGIFAGCQGNTNTTTTGANDANMVTVTWYNGSAELKSEKVEKGTKLTSWTPTVEGKEFTGWFSEASLDKEFDFETVINEDIDIFAAFKSNEYVEDTNVYYLIGSGAGSMAASGWDHAKSEANLSFTKEAVEGKNVYTITIDMYAGDMFQIAFGQSWDGQQGIGIMKGAEYADGTNAYDNTEYTAADKKYATVKDGNGNVIFDGSDEYNKGYEVWNIRLAPGQDGKYTFTLTTYPNNAQYNTLEWKLDEKLSAQEETHKMFFIGTHYDNWSTDFEAEGAEIWGLKASEDKSTWTGFITITEDMYADWTEGDPANLTGVKCAALKLYNTVNGEYVGDSNNGGNNFFLTAGTYCFKYTVDGNTVEYQALDYYVVGTFVDAEGKAVNFAIKEGVTPKLVNGTVTFEATDVTALGDFSWIKDQGKPGVMAIKVVYGCELGIRDWFGDDANGGDNYYVNAGTVTVTFDGTTVTVA